MTDYLGKEHAVFFRHLTNGVEAAINREKHFQLHDGSQSGKDRWAKWQIEVEPALRGSVLVTIVANVEHLVGKNSDKSWAIPPTWYGKNEFNKIRIIRHCWAHAAGRILPNRKTELEAFHSDLLSGVCLSREGTPIAPHFALNNDRVMLTGNGLDRIRVLSTELLAEKGLVIKYWEQSA